MCDYVELVKALRFAWEQPCYDCVLGEKCNWGDFCFFKRSADAIEELIAAVPKWVSVEERLPEQGERVLVSNGGFICESYLSQSGKWQRGGVDMFSMTPTHWMPLPEPPKEETE